MTEIQGWLLICAVLLTGLDGWARDLGAVLLLLGILATFLHRDTPRDPAP